eukprot:TRINITY_DN1867_c0_g1_i1.p1 TRINITY_DN1867_c0_g1~~TRINITY_DN1867_c0_g1_i1.p1  ORF type:complete len:1035 (+),score=375.50 TRINITY_DN1867_c0_g1_i1:48-3152(+)
MSSEDASMASLSEDTSFDSEDETETSSESESTATSEAPQPQSTRKTARYFRPETSVHGRRQADDDAVYRPKNRTEPAAAAPAPAAGGLVAAVKAAYGGVTPDDVEARPQPGWVTGAMKAHQTRGYSWMRALFDLGIGGVLGDEMGVGKTLQTIALLADLAERKVIGHPHPPALVVVPLSTMRNWEAEIAKFAPKVKVFAYAGPLEGRCALRDEVTAHLAAHKVPVSKDGEGYTLPRGAHCLLTTFELLRLDDYFTAPFRYPLVVVDEGHRYKGVGAAKIFDDPQRKHGLAHVPRRILLTGTPMQNNLTELWSLLHIVAPAVFTDAAAFASSKTATVKACLHYTTLRRTKAVVLSKLPPKRVFVLHCPMAPAQEVMYKEILRQAVGVKGADGTVKNVSNVVMQLRKACCHPYLFVGVEKNPQEAGEHLVLNSGKLAMLDKLLASFKADGRKVLIFSQFTSMLDILEDYIAYRGYNMVRLDGSSSVDARADAVANFSRPETFAFLLSTRAGGLGLNLVQANAVVIFDSDWNPFMDMQAQERVHRLGQTRPVDIYRLATHGTIEDIMLARATQKMKRANEVLEDPAALALIQADSGRVKAVELMQILKACAADTTADGGAAGGAAATPQGALVYTEADCAGHAQYAAFLHVETDVLLREAKRVLAECAGDDVPTAAAAAHKREHMVYDGVDYTELVSAAKIAKGEATLRELAMAAQGADGAAAEDDACDGSASPGLKALTPMEKEVERRKRKAKKWAAMKYTSRQVVMPHVPDFPDDAVHKYIAKLQPFIARKAEQAAALRLRTVSVLSEVPAEPLGKRKRTVGDSGEQDPKYAKAAGGDRRAAPPDAPTETDTRVDTDLAAAREQFAVCYGVHHVHGDVANPKASHAVQNVVSQAPRLAVHVTLVTINNTGSWSSRGVYRALDEAVGPRVRKGYEAAKEAQDLRFGDVHWFRSKTKYDVCVALCVTRDVVPTSAHLAAALARVAAACDALSAAGVTPVLHVPHFGLRGAEAAAMEEVYEQHFADRAPLFIHHYKKA